MHPRSFALRLATAALACAPSYGCDARNAGIDAGAHGEAIDPVDPGTNLRPTPHVARAAEVVPATGRDMGTGIVHFAWHEDRPREGSADTMLVRAEPRPEAPLVARFVYTFGSSHDGNVTWGWRVETTEPGLVAADVEFDYEENGLPLDSMAGDWLRVLYASAPAGETRAGWTAKRVNVQARSWSELFAERNLFFLDPRDVAFHDTAGGARTQIALARSDDAGERFDYTLYPLTIDGAWMHVRVVTPSDYCFDPVDPLERTAWIRFLDERGRPLVFYHSRGC